MEMKTIQAVIDKLEELKELAEFCNLAGEEIGDLLDSQETIEKEVPLRHQLSKEFMEEHEKKIVINPPVAVNR